MRRCSNLHRGIACTCRDQQVGNQVNPFQGKAGTRSLYRTQRAITQANVIKYTLKVLKILVDRSPQRIWIDIEVPMSEYSSHTYDFGPLYLWMLIFEVWKVAGNSACSFTNNVKMVGYPGLYQLIMIISISSFPGILHDAYDSILDIA